jgi:hypothetical protein
MKQSMAFRLKQCPRRSMAVVHLPGATADSAEVIVAYRGDDCPSDLTTG